MNFVSISKDMDDIATKIVDAAYQVHLKHGPGLLEKIYETCFCHELSTKGVTFKRQVELPIEYDGMIFNEGLRLDVLVEDCIICELKASEKHTKVWDAQLMTYLKLANKRLGFLINFNVPIIKHGIKRIVL